ncbi:MAG: tetratricopeptide repeat protein [Anaerolineae bacterium]|nr:tetratricopeptide repeat protein [Anaerolineae bacterium]
MSTFVSYVVGAIRERFAGFGQRIENSLNSMAGAAIRDSDRLVGDLANEILDIGEHFVLVWDNFEDIEGAFGLRDYIARLIEILPANCHVMIGSRILPDVPVTRLVAKRQLVGLTAEDLRFDAQEILELLGMSQIEVSEAEAEAIVSGSEGWITGVLLVADLAREEAGALLRAAGKASAETFDYLASDVLSRQPVHLQDFLCRSAVLREMNVRLCGDILQLRDPAALLAEVERRNLFITRFGDGQSSTYRYHSLFRTFLIDELRERDHGQFVDLNLRAAEGFQQTDDVDEAIYHYVSAEAFPDAVTLMERVAMESFTRGRSDTIVNWVNALPENMRASAPWISFYHSRVLTDRFDYEGARKSLKYAEEGFLTRGDSSLLSRIHNQRATLALFEGRYEDTLAEALAALNLLGEAEQLERAEARRLVGRAYAGLGRLADGVCELEAALKDFRKFGSPYDVVNLLQDLSFVLTTQASFEQAAMYLTEALSVARRLGSLPQLAGILNNLANVYYCRGEYVRALPLYEDGLIAARRGGDPRWQAYISIGMADLYRDIQAYDEAERYYAAGWDLICGSEPGIAFYILSAQADMARWQDRLVECEEMLARARVLAEEKSLDAEIQGALKVCEGAFLTASGDPGSGRELLTEAVAYLDRTQMLSDLVKARFLLALAHLSAGDPEDAATELDRAVNLTDKLGTTQFAYTEGQHAVDLLEFGVDAGISGCQMILDEIAVHHRRRSELLGTGEEPEMAPASRLEIFALGEGRVIRDGEAVESSQWRAVTAKELFFCVLLNGPISRDAIGLEFWPELRAKSARDTFHSTMYRVRRAVGSDVVKLIDGEYRVALSNYWFDVVEFERVVERARLLPPHDWQAEDLWGRAVELYAGDFLPEIDRMWTVTLRERYREMYLEALIDLGRCSEARNNHLEAVRRYQRALEVDNLREDLYGRLMTCLAAAGRRSDAISQYDRYRSVFMEELGVEPSPEITAIYKRITGRTPS